MHWLGYWMLGIVVYWLVGMAVLRCLDAAPDFPAEPDEGAEKIGAVILWPLLLGAYLWKRYR